MQVQKVGNKVTNVSTIAVAKPKSVVQTAPKPVARPVAPKPNPTIQAANAVALTSKGVNNHVTSDSDSRKAVSAQTNSVTATNSSSNEHRPTQSSSKRTSDKSLSHESDDGIGNSSAGRVKSLSNNKGKAKASTSRKFTDDDGDGSGARDDSRASKKRRTSTTEKPDAFKPRPTNMSRTSSLDDAHSQNSSPRLVTERKPTKPKTGGASHEVKKGLSGTPSTPQKAGLVKEEDVNDEDGYHSETSDDESMPGALLRKREATPMVERDVLASEDGNAPHVSGAQLVAGNRKAYFHYFADLSDPSRSTSEWAGEEVPSVTLEYPAHNSSERFTLLAPKDADEYNPITDVISTIRLVLDNFLTSSQAHSLFNHTQGPSSFSAFLSAPGSRSATPGTPVERASPVSAPQPPLMRALDKARSKRDGPGFLAEVERYNSVIRQLKLEDKLRENIRDMKGLKQKVWEKVASQAYERAVGPEIDELRKYPAFSDNVYGELLPKFMAEIFHKTKLNSNSVFVDLGSGVGNCVVQAALATGCEAWGFENMKHASALARKQVVEAESRFRMWGIKAGSMHVVEADFCEEPQVGEVLKRADVILVNNEVFTSTLNERLSLLFLDLRAGTQIVSLKAFASSFTLSQHNRHSPLAIIRQGQALTYPRNSVSWKSEPGTYYIGTIDRTMLEKFDEQHRD
ncbi:Nucleosomal histone H3-Lys79 methylase [Microbotryomycetes sp. JL221]|nr:Nucleosomal histone H3-Lys79 methylase [Microbotryomycetes sp. JL221]